MVCCVAVPPPEPQRTGLDKPISKHGFCTGPLIGIKHKPQQLLIIKILLFYKHFYGKYYSNKYPLVTDGVTGQAEQCTLLLK